MASSRDPGSSPTQYIHDNELGHDVTALRTPVSPPPNSSAPHECATTGQRNDLFSSREDAPLPPPHGLEGDLPTTDDTYDIGEGSPFESDSRNIFSDQMYDTPTGWSRTSSPVEQEPAPVHERVPESPTTAYNKVTSTAPAASPWSPGFPTSGTFAQGDGFAVPRTSVDSNEEFDQRIRQAECSLTPKQKSKIAKAEAKDNQRLSKIIKEEAKVEKKALELVIGELADMQIHQKQAVKDEAKARASHAKVLAAFKKQEAVYRTVKTHYETLLGQLNAESERLEAVRESARRAMENVTKKSQEVDGLRRMYSIDEREREAMLGHLKLRRN